MITLSQQHGMLWAGMAMHAANAKANSFVLYAFLPS